jgi:Tfp pilus assembly protein PilV
MRGNRKQSLMRADLTLALSRRERGRRRARGIVLLVIIVVVFVAGVIGLSVAKLVAAQRQTLQTQWRQEQTAWLAESALERAAARLAADPSYRGETWTVAAQDLAGAQGGVVTIRVQADAMPKAKGTVPFSSNENRDSPPRVRVQVEADYPDHPHLRARCTKEAIVSLPKGAKS